MSIKMFNIVALSDDAVVINGAGGTGGKTAGRRKSKKAPKSRRKKVTPKKKKATKTYMEAKIQYLVNEAKWNATKILCEKNNWKFKILTEKTLFNAN